MSGQVTVTGGRSARLIVTGGYCVSLWNLVRSVEWKGSGKTAVYMLGPGQLR